MKNIFIFWTTAFFCVFLSSCSTPPPEKPALKEYSNETNRIFEMIERGNYPKKSYGEKEAEKTEAINSINDLPPEPPSPPRQTKIKAKLSHKQKKERSQSKGQKKTKSKKTKEVQTTAQVLDEKPQAPSEEEESSKPNPPVEERHSPSAQSSPRSEKDVEIEQNLAFYCMKHRKDKKFQGDEKKCSDFATARLKECQEQHRSSGKILNCIKGKLK